jgi:rRNA maturation endonuclease Nob1
MSKLKVGSKVKVVGKYNITCVGCEKTVYSKMYGKCGKITDIKKSLEKYIYTVKIAGKDVKYMEDELCF